MKYILLWTFSLEILCCNAKEWEGDGKGIISSYLFNIQS